MKNYYKILGVLTAATPHEIRRAYRILARRYHPDLNPGEQSAARFKEIAAAYAVLSDREKRALYDVELEARQRATLEERFRTFQHGFTAGQAESQRTTKNAAKPSASPKTVQSRSSNSLISHARTFYKTIGKKITSAWNATADFTTRGAQSLRRSKGRTVLKVSIVEVSLTIEDSIRGIRKKIEISEPEGVRRVSVVIPPGVRDGSVIRLRDREQSGEDLVLLVRLAHHPFLSIKPKGLVAEIPITVQEAIAGAQITVPGIDDQIVIKIPPGAQSGTEIRIKEQGIQSRAGTRADYFIRLLIRVPESPDAVGLKDKAKELEQYYAQKVRDGFPKTILE